MENKRIEGIGLQIKGTLKEQFGKLIGDAKLVSDGAAERAVGYAQTMTDAVAGQIIPGIDTDRIAGVGHQVKGAIKAGYGSLIGNAKLTAEGAAEREAGKVQNEAGSARDEAQEINEAFQKPLVPAPSHARDAPAGEEYNRDHLTSIEKYKSTNRPTPS